MPLLSELHCVLRAEKNAAFSTSKSRLKSLQFRVKKVFMLLNHIAIIISSEIGVEFYKSLGFTELSREVRPESHDELLYLSNGSIVLEVYKDPTHPKRPNNPEAYGLRHLCFQVENIGEEYKVDKKGKFKFIYDPDGLPIEIREVKPKAPENWSFTD